MGLLRVFKSIIAYGQYLFVIAKLSAALNMIMLRLDLTHTDHANTRPE